MSSVNRNKQLVTGIFTLLALIVTAISLFPLLWMIVSAFKPAKEVLKANPLRFFPSTWDFANLSKLFKDTTYPFLTAMKSSAFVAITAALLSITINSMAAYAYARLEFKFKKLLWRTTIFTMYIPGITILVTSFVVVNSLGMLDSYAVLILPGLAGAYAIFFFRQFFLNMPMATEEAALIDGAGRFRIFVSAFLSPMPNPRL